MRVCYVNQQADGLSGTIGPGKILRQSNLDKCLYVRFIYHLFLCHLALIFTDVKIVRPVKWFEVITTLREGLPFQLHPTRKELMYLVLTL